MAVLKKIKASTLMETLVASVLIVIIFMMSSMILNNIFSSAVKNNTSDIETFINELEYFYKNEKLILPYYDSFQSWDIKVTSAEGINSNLISFEAVERHTNRTYSRQIYANKS